jgi:hypothetical protein
MNFWIIQTNYHLMPQAHVIACSKNLSKLLILSIPVISVLFDRRRLQDKEVQALNYKWRCKYKL